MKKLKYIKIKEIEIPVRLNSNKNVKNFKIAFNIDKGYMNISKPKFMSFSIVEKYIKINEELIYIEYLKILEYKKEIDVEKEKNKRKWCTGEKILYLGKEYELVIKEANKNIATITFEEEDKIVITINTNLDEKNKKDYILKVVKKMLKKEAEKVIYDRLKYLTKITGISYNTFKVKYVKTRWGSCVKNTKSLNFSSRIIMFPIEIIDAVIVHEL